MIKLQAKLW